jgi:hypothetical protein
VKPLACKRFNCNVWLTRHAEAMMLERKVSQAELIDLIETGDIKYRSETH